MYYGFELSKLPKITNFYCITRNTVWQITEKSHILIFVSSGSCEIIYDNKCHTLNTGDCFFVPANHSYTRRPQNHDKCTMTYIHFELDSNIEEYSLEDLKSRLTKTKETLNFDILQGESSTDIKSFIYLQNINKIPDKTDELLS